MWIGITAITAFLPLFGSVLGSENKILETDCECGIKNKDALLNDLPRGIFSENHAWPWMVSIVNVTIPEDPVAYCGATLINDRYILTAAHCIPDMLDSGIRNFRIYLATNDIQNGNGYLDLGIRKIFSHSSFDYETADYDVSLIKLSEPVLFNHDISTICLRQAGASYVGEAGYITGWGSYNLTEPTENSLKEAEAYIVSNEICSKNYTEAEIPITENMICASIPDSDDPCKGDSGGPLTVLTTTSEGKEIYTQIGIISHGQGCAVPGYPAIFSRVSSFIHWIKENTKDGVYCKGAFSS